jgi:CRP/FNR family cyclic AMP-dependent transcriptional regulator
MTVDLTLFQKDPNYRGFKPEDWALLSNYLDEISFKAKSRIFKESDPGDGFYWIRQGNVRISRSFIPEGQKKSQENLLTVLAPGNVFGEMALIDQAPRSADATTETDVVLFFLSNDKYKKLCQEHPSTAMAIQDTLTRTLSTRIREANKSFETIRFWCS